jgi:phosphoenolpyruvate-protein kinase (PTS system EI component)
MTTLRILAATLLAALAIPAVAQAHGGVAGKHGPRVCKAVERDAQRSQPRLTDEQREAIRSACATYRQAATAAKTKHRDARRARNAAVRAAHAQLRADCPKVEGETRQARRERCAAAIATFRAGVRDAQRQFRTVRREARTEHRVALRELVAAVRAALGTTSRSAKRR